MSAAPVQVGIALCGELASSAELEALRVRLEDQVTGVEVEIVADLCHRPDHAPELASRGAERIVFGLCDPPQAPHEFQAWARRAGLDPFAFELVTLRSAAPAGNAVPLLAAAAARLRASGESAPEQLKLRLLPMDGKRSRRSLLTLPPSTYRPIAAVASSRCLGDRCSLCLPACPRGAIGTSAGLLVVDRALCDGCGLCVSACPAEAIALPGSSLPQYKAEIDSLLAAGERPRLVFTCGEVDPSAFDGEWLPVSVPCAGMVTPGWILQALARGAESVAVRACGECRLGQGSVAAERIEYAQALLRLLGEREADERVLLLDGGPVPQPADGAKRASRRRGSLTLVEPDATAAAVLALADAHGADEARLSHERSPLGLVALRQEACTACGACATACPTDALVMDERADGTAVSFDPVRCVGCGRCVSACPEADAGALRARRVTDLSALAGGQTVLKRDAVVRCRRCQGPVAPRAMLDRIGELLRGDERDDVLVEALARLCPDCRGLGEPLAGDDRSRSVSPIVPT